MTIDKWRISAELKRVRKRPKRLAVLVLGIVATVIAGRFVIRFLDHRKSQEAWANQHLRIPEKERRLLTDGTADSVAWLEKQLEAEQGRLVALYILDSMVMGGLSSLPKPMPVMAFCGNTSARKRRKYIRDTVRAFLTEQDDAIEDYFSVRHHLQFQPLSVVDWSDPSDIEGSFLQAVESKDVGLMVVLLDYEASARVNPIVHPSDDRRVRFHRVDGNYDVQQLSQSRRRLIAYEVVGGSDRYLDGETMWLSFDVEDFEGDGLQGITRVRFGSRLGSQDTVPTTQPPAPSWDDLMQESRRNGG